jgi:predicted regulator of Ras-like GTPase activity (Roadblock/LC7/MglB family)
MDDEIYSFALKSTLNEIQSICPDVKSSFMFTEDGEIIAANENTPENTLVQVVDAFDGIMEKADALGGVEGIIFEGSKGRVSITSVNRFYLVTVTAKDADRNLVDTVTRVLVPTVLRLLEKITPAPLKNIQPKPTIEPEISRTEAIEEPLNEPVEERRIRELERPAEPETRPETVVPEPPVNQFIVENIGGLLVPADTVRIDSDVLVQWEELYEGRKIEEVEIETFGGKSVQCKVKQIKDSKYEGKGILQMPEKVQITLEIRKGELVRVKPVIQ